MQSTDTHKQPLFKCLLQSQSSDRNILNRTILGCFYINESLIFVVAKSSKNFNIKQKQTHFFVILGYLMQFNDGRCVGTSQNYTR